MESVLVVKENHDCGQTPMFPLEKEKCMQHIRVGKKTFTVSSKMFNERFYIFSYAADLLEYSSLTKRNHHFPI